MTAFDDLMAFQRETEALAQVAGRLSWDQETMMPRGAAEQRGEEMGAMEAILHARRVEPKLGAWLEEIDDSTLNEVGRAQLRLIRRSYTRTQKVPAKLAAEIARVTSVAQGIWAEARAKNDVAHFLPTLAKVVALRREEAAALAGDGDLYDALLDDYEAGNTGAKIEEMFAAMRPRLVALREKVLGAEKQPKALEGTYPADVQIRLAHDLAAAFGYDFQHGRIDQVVHPFCSGGGLDVRVTTRVSESDPFNCLYSTIHEIGHAAYEQGIDRAYLLTPIGGGVSMGVHESQSRIYENQLGRGRAFTGWLLGKMQSGFGLLNDMDAETFYATVNRVNPGYIRTEADEVHYNLHILMRFDLERALITGKLEVEDLEEVWNQRFEADFGVKVDVPAHGVLQDVHWSVGLFGYFPTYTLGNVYAGCLHKALIQDLPDLDADLALGKTERATEWLRDKVQRNGGLYEPVDTIARAIGEEPSVEPLLSYLEQKFGEIYNL